MAVNTLIACVWIGRMKPRPRARRVKTVEYQDGACRVKGRARAFQRRGRDRATSRSGPVDHAVKARSRPCPRCWRAQDGGGAPDCGVGPHAVEPAARGLDSHKIHKNTDKNAGRIVLCHRERIAFGGGNVLKSIFPRLARARQIGAPGESGGRGGSQFEPRKPVPASARAPQPPRWPLLGPHPSLAFAPGFDFELWGRRNLRFLAVLGRLRRALYARLGLSM